MNRRPVRLGSRLVGEGYAPFIVAEVGINHNGDLELAKQLIDASVQAGCDAVKFQKRTIELVYAPEELARPRESPFGQSNGDLKRGLEFGVEAYQVIDRYCRERGIVWFASCWDAQSVEFMEPFNPPCYKIASACLTDEALLRHVRSKGRPVILSTGMSTMEQICRAVDVLGEEELILLHCTSTYPSPPEELNLRMIPTLQRQFNCPVGYSGHEVGLATSVAAVALGACLIERHITLDRARWGSDQAASVEPHGFGRLVRDIQAIARALGDGRKQVYESEKPVMAKLRRVVSG